jgi:hypothetical protein
MKGDTMYSSRRFFSEDAWVDFNEWLRDFHGEIVNVSHTTVPIGRFDFWMDIVVVYKNLT